MTTFEHSRIVARPPEHVAAALTTPTARPLYAPSLVRVALATTADGRAGDLAYQPVRTTATSPPVAVEGGRLGRTRTSSPFVGRGVEGRLEYELEPVGDRTTLVQRAVYEFAEWASIDLLDGATAATNDRRLAAHLATVVDLLEGDSELLPLPADTTARSTHPREGGERRATRRQPEAVVEPTEQDAT